MFGFASKTTEKLGEKRYFDKLQLHYEELIMRVTKTGIIIRC